MFLIECSFISYLYFVVERDLVKFKYDLDRIDLLENNYILVFSVFNILFGYYFVFILSSIIIVIVFIYYGNNIIESWFEFYED